MCNYKELNGPLYRMQLPWHLIYFDELLIMCSVGIASIKINNWIINTKIQSWDFFFIPGSICAQDHRVSFACMFLFLPSP